jgi:hypothetical protein
MKRCVSHKTKDRGDGGSLSGPAMPQVSALGDFVLVVGFGERAGDLSYSTSCSSASHTRHRILRWLVSPTDVVSIETGSLVL